MENKYDVVVIGSGFGGAITACRLAQSGRSVLVIEKGKRWDRYDFPRGSGEVAKSCFASAEHPKPEDGFIEYLTFPNMDVIQGTGVGGGSLHYFNVHITPPGFIFDSPAWPEHLTLKRLRPYYNLAADMLGAKPISHDTDRGVPLRTQVFEDAVNSLGLEAERVPICVHLSSNTKDGNSKPACDHCGNCMLGCQLHAKNTLDLNYIPLAEKHGAKILAQHEALNVSPDSQGYSVTCRDLSAAPADIKQHTLKKFKAKQVIVAAGTLGTNQLLLNCKNISQTLPRISDRLGQSFSGNGDMLFAGTHYQNRTVDPGRGPSITSGISFRHPNNQYIFIEDLGYPDPFIWYFNNVIPTKGRFKKLLSLALNYIGEARGTGMDFKLEELLNDGYLSNFLPYLGMGTDAADGTLTLNRKGKIRLNWTQKNSLPLFRNMIQHMKDISTASGGKFVNSFLWKSPVFKIPMQRTLTAHPLGGCAMSDSPLKGVTNDRGEVWGYKGLFVADGALMSAAVGVNPSATISAVAERIAFNIIHKRDLQEDDVSRPLNTQAVVPEKIIVAAKQTVAPKPDVTSNDKQKLADKELLK